MDNLIELEELGLTKNEMKVYQTLLEHGKLGSGELSRFSSVPYGRIYDVIASLEQKGMIKIIPEKTKKFIALDPGEFEDLIKKKKEALDALGEKIKGLKHLYAQRTEDPVILGYGKAAFYKIDKIMKKPQKFSYSVKYTSEYRPEWERNHIESAKKGIDSRSLVRYDEETKSNVKQWLTIKKKIKKFNNNGIAMAINEQEVLISLIKSNVTLLVRDKNFCQIMGQLFLDSYKNAEEIK